MANPCPTCAGAVPEESVWLLWGKFYCSEQCAAKHVKKGA